jgi:hypothetical protein
LFLAVVLSTIPPVTSAEPSVFTFEINEFTLPETSSVQSPAGMIMPALAIEAEAKIAPAAVFVYANLS